MAETLPELVIRSFSDVADVLRAVQNHRQVSNAALEHAAGVCPGFVDKYLGPSREKRLGPLAFDLLLGALGLELVVQPAPHAAQRMASRWEKRNGTQVRNSQPISQTTLDRCRPVILAELGHAGGIASAKARRRAQRRSGHATNGHARP
jgi:hypothetical protein